MRLRVHFAIGAVTASIAIALSAASVGATTPSQAAPGVSADSVKDGKIVSHVDSVYMTPTEFSKLK